MPRAVKAATGRLYRAGEEEAVASEAGAILQHSHLRKPSKKTATWRLHYSCKKKRKNDIAMSKLQGNGRVSSQNSILSSKDEHHHSHQGLARKATLLTSEAIATPVYLCVAQAARRLASGFVQQANLKRRLEAWFRRGRIDLQELATLLSHPHRPTNKLLNPRHIHHLQVTQATQALRQQRHVGRQDSR